jgi:hypothetical protein
MRHRALWRKAKPGTVTVYRVSFKETSCCAMLLKIPESCAELGEG